MQELLRKASELGKRIAQHERFVHLRQAEDMAGESTEAGKLLRAFEEQQRKIARLEAEKKPIEPEDKRELQHLHEQVRSTPALQDLARAQADYMEMMNRVNAAIRREMEPPAVHGAAQGGPKNAPAG